MNRCSIHKRSCILGSLRRTVVANLASLICYIRCSGAEGRPVERSLGQSTVGLGGPQPGGTFAHGFFSNRAMVPMAGDRFSR
jgi:hypothetical protein